jgi:hypothetical protein
MGNANKTNNDEPERRKADRRVGEPERRSDQMRAAVGERRGAEDRGVGVAMVDALEDILQWERASERALRVAAKSE